MIDNSYIYIHKNNIYYLPIIAPTFVAGYFKAVQLYDGGVGLFQHQNISIRIFKTDSLIWVVAIDMAYFILVKEYRYSTTIVAITITQGSISRSHECNVHRSYFWSVWISIPRRWAALLSISIHIRICYIENPAIPLHYWHRFEITQFFIKTS